MNTIGLIFSSIFVLAGFTIIVALLWMVCKNLYEDIMRKKDHEH